MMAPEGAREAGDPAPVPVTIVPDPEVPERLERARRRQFTVGYKLRILTEADGARTTGEIGALLRREGLYCSHLAAWRRQREEGILHLSRSLRARRQRLPTTSRTLAFMHETLL